MILRIEFLPKGNPYSHENLANFENWGEIRLFIQDSKLLFNHLVLQ